MVQERRRLRADSPEKILGEILGECINGLREGFTLCRVGRFDDRLDRIQQLVHVCNFLIHHFAPRFQIALTAAFLAARIRRIAAADPVNA